MSEEDEIRYAIGDRVLILEPYWNDQIWGGLATVIEIWPDWRNRGHGPYKIQLDEPYQREPTANWHDWVYVHNNEIELINRHPTTHNTWSHP